jgi:hypothetical protein
MTITTLVQILVYINHFLWMLVYIITCTNWIQLALGPRKACTPILGCFVRCVQGVWRNTHKQGFTNYLIGLGRRRLLCFCRRIKEVGRSFTTYTYQARTHMPPLYWMDAGAPESERAPGSHGRVASRLDLALGRAVGGKEVWRRLILATRLQPWWSHVSRSSPLLPLRRALSLDATAQNLFSPGFNQSIFCQAGHRIHSTSATVATPYFASPPSSASLSQHLPGPRHRHTSPSYSAKSVVSLHLAHLRQRQSMSRACSLRKGDLQIQLVEERQQNRLYWRDRRRPAGRGERRVAAAEIRTCCGRV